MAWTQKPSEVRIKTVTKVQEKVHVVTRIVERPDGTKETVIISKTDRRTSRVKTRRESRRTTMVSVSQSMNKSLPVYTISVQKELFASLGLGVYGRTDREFGFSLSYSF